MRNFDQRNNVGPPNSYNFEWNTSHSFGNLNKNYVTNKNIITDDLCLYRLLLQQNIYNNLYNRTIYFGVLV